jgi:hypothetical protein
MADEQKNEEQVQDTDNDNNPVVQDTTPKVETRKPEPPKIDNQDMFPAEYVQELREENAKWRTKLRTVEQQVETLSESIRQKDIQQTKLETIQELGLPSDAMEFLTGEDAETIRAQAEKFKALIPDAPEAGSQQTSKRAITALPGGEPRQETREQKNQRLGLSFGGSNIIQ